MAGFKPVNVGSSDDGTLTPSRSATSVVSGADDIPGSPRVVRNTRARRSSLLTEENVASLSPARRTRRNSHLSEDGSNIAAPGRRTPSKSAAPVDESKKIVTRRVSIRLTPCPTPIVEQKEEAEEEVIIAVEPKPIAQVETIVEVPEPTELDSPKEADTMAAEPVVQSNADTSTTTVEHNVWAPKPEQSNVDPDETIFMDVDESMVQADTIIVLSDSDEQHSKSPPKANFQGTPMSTKKPKNATNPVIETESPGFKLTGLTRDSPNIVQKHILGNTRASPVVIFSPPARSPTSSENSEIARIINMSPKADGDKQTVAQKEATAAEIDRIINTLASPRPNENKSESQLPSKEIAVSGEEPTPTKVIQKWASASMPLLTSPIVSPPRDEIVEPSTPMAVETEQLATETIGIHKQDSLPLFASPAIHELTIHELSQASNAADVNEEHLDESTLLRTPVAKSPVAEPQSGRTLFGSSVKKVPGITPIASKAELPATPPKAMPPPKSPQQRIVQFEEKAASPVPVKPTESEKHVDTPFPTKRMSASDRSLNGSGVEGTDRYNYTHFYICFVLVN